MKLAAFIKLYPSTYVTLEEYTPNLQKIYTYLGKTSAEKNVYFGPLFFRTSKTTFCAYNRKHFYDDNDGCNDNYDENYGHFDDDYEKNY